MEAMRISFNVFLFLFLFSISCVNEDIDRPPACDNSLSFTDVSRINPVTCSEKGIISLTAIGGSSPYQFSRNGLPRQTSGIFDNLPSGSHTITVFDSNDCSAVITLEITQPPASGLSLLITSVTGDNSCTADNGSVTLGWSGTGASPFLYSFNNSPFTSTVTYNNLSPGDYAAVVQDANGCTDTQSVKIERLSTNTKWSTQVKDILVSKCVGCHPGSGSSDNWADYSSVFSKRSNIRLRVAAGTMPPGGSLSASDKAAILCWIDDGAPNN